jgi:hypothetical protein
LTPADCPFNHLLLKKRFENMTPDAFQESPGLTSLPGNNPESTTNGTTTNDEINRTPEKVAFALQPSQTDDDHVAEMVQHIFTVMNSGDMEIIGGDITKIVARLALAIKKLLDLNPDIMDHPLGREHLTALAVRDVSQRWLPGWEYLANHCHDPPPSEPSSPEPQPSTVTSDMNTEPKTPRRIQPMSIPVVITHHIAAEDEQFEDYLLAPRHIKVTWSDAELRDNWIRAQADGYKFDDWRFQVELGVLYDDRVLDSDDDESDTSSARGEARENDWPARPRNAPSGLSTDQIYDVIGTYLEECHDKWLENKMPSVLATLAKIVGGMSDEEKRRKSRDREGLIANFSARVNQLTNKIMFTIQGTKMRERGIRMACRNLDVTVEDMTRCAVEFEVYSGRMDPTAPQNLQTPRHQSAHRPYRDTSASPWDSRPVRARDSRPVRVRDSRPVRASPRVPASRRRASRRLDTGREDGSIEGDNASGDSSTEREDSSDGDGSDDGTDHENRSDRELESSIERMDISDREASGDGMDVDVEPQSANGGPKRIILLVNGERGPPWTPLPVGGKRRRSSSRGRVSKRRASSPQTPVPRKRARTSDQDTTAGAPDIEMVDLDLVTSPVTYPVTYPVASPEPQRPPLERHDWPADRGTIETRAQAARRVREIKERFEARAAVAQAGSLDNIVNPGRADDEMDIFINHTVSTSMARHQLEGIRFMYREIAHKEEHISGCLLAHVMGLGKTMQVIAVLAAIRLTAMNAPEQLPGPLRMLRVLIMAPPGLLDNWAEEFDRWLPDEHHFAGIGAAWRGGIHKLVARVPQDDRLPMLQRWHDYGGVLLVGYGLFAQLAAPLGGYKSPLPSPMTPMEHLLLHTASIVILDESHKTNSPATNLAKGIARLTCRRRVALSGSPISNWLSEYHNIGDWVAPGFLGAKEVFGKRYVQVITKGSWHDSEPEHKRAARVALRALQTCMVNKVQSRGIEVIEHLLHGKHDFVIQGQPTTEQQVLSDMFVRVILGNDGLYKELRLLAIEKHWKLLMNHPDVFRAKFLELAGKERGQNDNYEADELKAIVDFCNANPTAAIGGSSGSVKVEMAMHILRQSKRVGDKVLLFSNTLRTLEFMGRLMAREGIRTYYLDGNTATADRQSMAKRFNSSTDVDAFLISTTAGAEGLNLHGANRVILFDFGWSPTTEAQCIGRAYRMRQQKHVYVYRLIIAGTQEPGLFERYMMKSRQHASAIARRNTDLSSARRTETVYRPVRQTFPASPQALAAVVGLDSVLDSAISPTLTMPIAAIDRLEAFMRDDEYVMTEADLRKAEWMAR